MYQLIFTNMSCVGSLTINFQAILELENDAELNTLFEHKRLKMKFDFSNIRSVID